MKVLTPGERRGGRAAGRPVTSSLVLAMLFDLIPLGGEIDSIRPDLTLLVCLFWSTRRHSPANVGAAWGLGLLRDIATLTPLGLGAGLYALTAWAGMLLRKRFDALPIPGELLLVLLILLSTSLLGWSVEWLVDGRPSPQTHLVTPLVGTLCWLPLRVLLARRELQRNNDD